MMALAGKDVVVKFKTSESGPAEPIGGINNVSLSDGRANIDVTTFGAKNIERIAGLLDHPVTVSGFFEANDPGQQAIRDNYLNGTDLWIQILPDGTNGFEVKVLVSSFEISASVDGAVEFNAELESTGGVSEVLSGGGIEG